MKKVLGFLIMTLLIPSMQSATLAAEPLLISGTQVILSPAAAPNRLELRFDLSEPIDLSQKNANIIIEYLGEELESTNYIKDKSWSGYLNSYDNYPSGEQKYSSGYTNENYPDVVPAARIYTSTKTGTKIDVTKVAAVKITVLGTDGSGEEIVVGIDGNILAFKEVGPSDDEEIETHPDGSHPPATEQNLGIKIDSETAVLPLNTKLVAEELSGGSAYNAVSLLFTDAVSFIAIDIRLEAAGQTVQPDGRVKVSIPVPERFERANLAVYRIDDAGNKIPYAVEITTDEGIEYATFLTDHFSTYVLVEERKGQPQNGTPQIIVANPVRRESNQDSIQNKISENRAQENKVQENETFEKIETQENKIPQTGQAQTQSYIAVIISMIGLLVFINMKK